MNTIEKYFSHLNEFKDYELTRDMIAEANSLTLPSDNYVSSVQMIIDKYDNIFTEDQKSDDRAVRESLYILNRVILFYDQIYGSVYDYYTLRKNDYPSVEQQLDILYHQGYDGWKEAVQLTKDKYPKI